MKKKASLIIFVVLLLNSICFSQTKTEAAIAATVEKLKKAMIEADSATLAMLCSDNLSYGHSSGAIENKKEFIAKIISGKSDFISIELSNESVVVSGKTALVRHQLDAVTNNDGKPGEVHLLVLLVWQKQSGVWKLLARQAVKKM